MCVCMYVVGPRLIDGRGVLGGFGGFWWVLGGFGWFWGGGWQRSWLPALQDLLLDLLLRYPLFSCTVPCHTLSTSSCNLQDTLDFCIVVSWGWLRGANNVLGCPPYKIFSWTCCYAMHFSCNVPCHTLSTSSCNLQDTLDFCIVVSWGGVGGANNVLGCPPYKIFSWTCCYAMHFSCNVPCHTLSTSSCNLQDILDFCIVVSWGGVGGG